MSSGRFMLFSGEPYEASGGWDDFRRSYDSLDSAINAAKTGIALGSITGWYHIVDKETDQVVDCCGKVSTRDRVTLG